jgi:hypothetical protein
MGWLTRLIARRAPMMPAPGIERDASPVSPEALRSDQPVSPEALDAALARLQSEIPDPDLSRADGRRR